MPIVPQPRQPLHDLPDVHQRGPWTIVRAPLANQLLYGCRDGYVLVVDPAVPDSRLDELVRRVEAYRRGEPDTLVQPAAGAVMASLAVHDGPPEGERRPSRRRRAVLTLVEDPGAEQ